MEPSTAGTRYVDTASVPEVTVCSPDSFRLRALLVQHALTVTSPEPGHLMIYGASAEQIGDLAFAHEIRLFQLTERAPRRTMTAPSRPLSIVADLSAEDASGLGLPWLRDET